MNMRLSEIVGKPVIDIMSSQKEYMNTLIKNREVDAAFNTVDLGIVMRQV